MKKKLLYELIEFQEKHPYIYIGGSVSLILQKAIDIREPHDVDLISSQKIHIYDLFEVFDKNKHPRIKRYTSNSGVRFDLFFNPLAEYVTCNYHGHILKLSPVEEILDWKKRKLEEDMWSGNNKVKNKHLKDLKLL